MDFKRAVGAEIEVEVTAATRLDFQIAVARHPGVDVSESVSITLNRKDIECREIIGEHGTRIHNPFGGRGHLDDVVLGHGGRGGRAAPRE